MKGGFFILMESGYEKLRYVVGQATVVTREKMRFCDISNWSLKAAREMLGDPEFCTKCEY